MRLAGTLVALSTSLAALSGCALLADLGHGKTLAEPDDAGASCGVERRWLEPRGLACTDSSYEGSELVEPFDFLGQVVAHGESAIAPYAGSFDEVTRKLVPGTGSLQLVPGAFNLPWGVAVKGGRLYWTSSADADLHVIDDPDAGL